MTRSKAWLRVLGYGDGMKNLEAEYKRVKQKDFSLDFIYPSKEQRNEMNIVNRDMSPKEMNRIAREKKNFNVLVEALDRGELRKEDLSQEDLERMKKILLEK